MNQEYTYKLFYSISQDIRGWIYEIHPNIPILKSETLYSSHTEAKEAAIEHVHSLKNKEKQDA